MRARVFSTPTFYTSSIRLLVTIIKAYWHLLSCRKRVPPFPFTSERIRFSIESKKYSKKKKKKRKKRNIISIVPLTCTLEDILKPNGGETERIASSRVVRIRLFIFHLGFNGVHVLMKFDSAVVRCLNQCQTFYSTNWTRLVTDTVLMRHRKRGGSEGNNYDTKDSGPSMLINALMARLIAIGYPLLLTSTRRISKKYWNIWLISLIPFNPSIPCDVWWDWFGDVWRFFFERGNCAQIWRNM